MFKFGFMYAVYEMKYRLAKWLAERLINRSRRLSARADGLIQVMGRAYAQEKKIWEAQGFTYEEAEDDLVD